MGLPDQTFILIGDRAELVAIRTLGSRPQGVALRAVLSYRGWRRAGTRRRSPAGKALTTTKLI